MAYSEGMTWTTQDAPFFRPVYRLPSERDSPPRTRPELEAVGAPPLCGLHHIHQFGCFPIPDLGKLPWVAWNTLEAFAFADALHIAMEGEVEALLNPFPSPLMNWSRRKVFFHDSDLLRLAELKAVDSGQLKEIKEGAMWLAVKGTPLEAPVGEDYRTIYSKARKNIFRELFGPKGEGFYTSTKVQSLDAKLDEALDLGTDPVWIADPSVLEDAVLEKITPPGLSVLDPLSAGERSAVFCQYFAHDLGYSLKEHCSSRGLNYNSIKQNLSRARKRLQDELNWNHPKPCTSVTPGPAKIPSNYCYVWTPPISFHNLEKGLQEVFMRLLLALHWFDIDVDRWRVLLVTSDSTAVKEFCNGSSLGLIRELEDARRND